MKKLNKIIAMFVVFAMVVGNMTPMLKNISIAITNNVTVAITADSDNMMELSENHKSLIYTCADNTSYEFKLLKGTTELEFEKVTEEPNPGQFKDKYVVENISSNEDLFVTCPNIDFSKLNLKYGGENVPVVNGYTVSLDGLDDVSYYNFAVESEPDNGGQNGGEPGNPGDPNATYGIDFGTASWTVNGQEVTATVEGKVINNGPVQIGEQEIIKLTGFDSSTMDAIVKSNQEDFQTGLVVNENNETTLSTRNAENLPNEEFLSFVVEEKAEQGPEEFKPEANTNATVTVSSTNENAGSYIDARIELNGFPVIFDYEEGNPVPASTTTEVEYFSNENNNDKVRITFASLFIQKYIGTITVNNEEFIVDNCLNYSNRTDFLNHYDHQLLMFDVEVDKADSYDIVADLTDVDPDEIFIGNFLWSNDPAEEGEDTYIGHSRIELVQVEYQIDNNAVVVPEQDMFDNEYIEYDPAGSLVVPEGSLCTMRIIPEYGYQVTAFGINGQDIITGEVLSEFTFPISGGNFHLGAQVTQVDDIVDAQSEKVKSGNIEINGQDIESGSVVLTVSDAQIDDNKKAEFEEAAGDYTINSYLDIDLDQVVYKGSADDVWTNRIHELNNEATVILQLEEGVDGNNIIIVHNVNDGDEYEIIEIESYDSETNTITFKTKSFSNYAIAIKDNAQTGEETSTDKEQYTITAGDVTVIFSDDEGHNFELTIEDLANLTEEQLEEYGLTLEEYEQAKAEVIEALKEYGTVLNLYNIDIRDGQFEHNGEITIRIKMSDEMKKYNSFKLICIDNETISANDIAELKINGEYLEGNLYHLSNYALVATNVATEDNTNNSATETAKNPVTGDNIMTCIMLFAISTFGAFVTIKHNNNNKEGRH